MTHLLQDYFKGKGNIVIIINVNPSPDDFDETLMELEKSAIASGIRTTHNKVIVNEKENTLLLGKLKKLKEENHSLKEENIKMKKEMEKMNQNLHKAQTELSELDNLSKDTYDYYNPIHKNIIEKQEKHNDNQFFKSSDLFSEISTKDNIIKEKDREIQMKDKRILELEKELQCIRVNENFSSTKNNSFTKAPGSKFFKHFTKSKNTKTPSKKRPSTEVNEENDTFTDINLKVEKKPKFLLETKKNVADQSFNGTNHIPTYLAPVSSRPHYNKVSSPEVKIEKVRYSNDGKYDEDDDDNIGRFSDCKKNKENINTSNPSSAIRKRSSANIPSNSPLKRSDQSIPIGSLPVPVSTRLSSINDDHLSIFIDNNNNQTPSRENRTSSRPKKSTPYFKK